MKILILGPNGSGKSLYAEKLVSRFNVSLLYYIATMIPYGEEGMKRVEKHRKQRAELVFVTIEKPFVVSDIQIPPNTAILLEDVSNLLSNSLFCKDCNGNEESVFKDIAGLCRKSRHSVMVSISGLITGPEFDAETKGYISALNLLNEKLTRFADVVISMREGTPFIVKGDIYALD